MIPASSTTTMFPWTPNLKVPDVLESGVSLFATQTTVLTGMFLYHIPKYHLELSGVKKPSSKTCPDETRVRLFVRDWVAVKVFKEMAIVGKKVRHKMVKQWSLVIPLIVEFEASF
jgi:hypothetical protein